MCKGVSEAGRRDIGMLHPGVKSLAEKLLPRIVLAWLDPIQRLIDCEVRWAAARLGKLQIVLDAGAGEARYRECFTQARYFALDTGTGDPTWDYTRLDIRGDLEALPLRVQSVDGILCIVVLEHTRRPREVLAEFARILKPGGLLVLVIPLLWEEHQAPHDYFRFTRYGIHLLFESLPFRIDLLAPMGGFFWLLARRCVNFMIFFQGGWRWVVFFLLAPFFGFLFPIILYFMDGLDRSKRFTLGFRVRATRLDG